MALSSTFSTRFPANPAQANPISVGNPTAKSHYDLLHSNDLTMSVEIRRIDAALDGISITDSVDTLDNSLNDLASKVSKLGTAANKNVADPLEAVNSNPASLNNGNATTANRVYGTGITIPSRTGNWPVILRVVISNNIYTRRYLLADLLVLPISSVGRNSFTSEVESIGAYAAAPSLTLARTAGNELLLKTRHNPVVTGITLYIARQALSA